MALSFHMKNYRLLQIILLGLLLSTALLMWLPLNDEEIDIPVAGSLLEETKQPEAHPLKEDSKIKIKEENTALSMGLPLNDAAIEISVTGTMLEEMKHPSPSPLKKDRNIKIEKENTALLTGLPLNTAAIDIPVAGSMLEKTKQTAPSPLKEDTNIKIEEENTRSSETLQSAGTKVLVRGFRITGNTVFSESELMGTVSFYLDRELTIGELQKTADGITNYYRGKGYILSRAYLPAQQITDGIIKISIIEGSIGHIEVIKSENTNMHGDTLKWFMSGSLKEGDVIKEDRLERGTLLINDLPSIQIQSILKPGSTVGTTDLVIVLKEDKPFYASIEADNFGNRYAGPYRIGITARANNPGGFGESYSIRGLTSEGMKYGDLSLSVPAGRWGSSVNGGYSSMNYSLIDDFKDLNAEGSAGIWTLDVLHPFLRTTEFNLYGNLQYEHKAFDDRIELMSSRSYKHINSFMLSLFIEEHDRLLGEGFGNLTLSGFSGNLNIKSKDTMEMDNATLRTGGHYRKTTIVARRTQYINSKLTFFASLTGQIASKNLDCSEDFYLGGPYGVRSYPQGEVNGDNGYIATGEIRYLLPESLLLPGNIQTSAFLDYGAVRINHDPPDGFKSVNTVNLAGVGMGLYWSWKSWFLKMCYAMKTGKEQPALDPDNSGRFWLNAGASF
jgi:hemolysin activation/secretion protein